MGIRESLKWLNNNLLPISYKLWKEDQDKIFYKIDKKLRLNWLSTQHTIHSSMNLPFTIFVLTLIAFILFEFPDIKKFISSWAFIYYVFSVMLIIIVVWILLLNQHYDRYTNEKYLELS